MDDRKIETLLSTIRHGSFSKAAIDLCCTQSAVTQTMNAFESEIGFKLLKRSYNGVTLTPDGEEIYPNIVEVYEAMNRMKQNANRISSGRDTPLRIGAFSSISNNKLGRIIGRFQREHPDIGITLNIATKELHKWLVHGDVDIIIGDEDISASFRWCTLFKDPYYAVLPEETKTSSNESITIEELLTYPVIVSSFSDLRKQLENAKHVIDITCDDDTTVLNLVSDGLGVSAIPRLSLDRLPSGVKKLKLEPLVSRNIGYALPNQPRKEAKIFVKYIEDLASPFEG